jgi:hypothetical protein
MVLRTAFALVAAGLVWGWGTVASPPMPAGLYEVRFRLELPHLERWGVEKVRTVCLPGQRGEAPIPVLSGNMPFSGCRARRLAREGQTLSYDIICAGRDGARARASYVLLAQDFSGRVAMTLGAKNMTMTEVQSGHRLGSCRPPEYRGDDPNS